MTQRMREIAARDKDQAFVADLAVRLDRRGEGFAGLLDPPTDACDSTAAQSREGDHLRATGALRRLRSAGEPRSRTRDVAPLSLPLRCAGLGERPSRPIP